MKIKFLIGYPAKSFVTEWQEIKKLSKKEAVPNEDTFVLFKALELNKELEKELIKSRNNLHLPEIGVSWEEYKKRKDVKADHTKEELDEIIYFIHNYRKEIHRITRKMYLHPQVEEQLENLILGDFVEPYFRGISYGCNGANVEDYESIEDFDRNVEVDTVIIDITKKISKNELLKYIDNQWDEITRLLKYLPEVKHFYVSPRDMRIVELRDGQKLKYNEIAEKIIKEFSIDDINGSINEDSIKTSYKRAKSKIDELAKIKKSNISSR